MTFIFLLLLTSNIVVGFLLAACRKIREQQKVESDNIINDLRRKNSEFSKYLPIQNVEAEVRRIQVGLQRLKEDTIKEIEADKAETKALKAAIREQKKEAKAEQEKLIAATSKEASFLLQSAHQEAGKIGGDAYRALRESEQLEATATAMRNIIKGYGDEYLIPNHSTLDDLAEEFSHKDAGQNLKLARDRTRQMVTDQLAANCEYSEPKRKEAAEHFVVDAFNGKVDSILSRVKRDNFGKLEQEISDAFTIVGHNGKAFRDARIMPAYLQARQAELRWAVATHVLRQEEREEQRQIKEQIREEAKAQREYEKALKQAEKEEKLLEKLMAEAKAKLADATAEDRRAFEAKISELEAKYQEAEERNKRTLSMAQQTRRGFVYVISNVGSFGENVFKIGLTRRLEPLDRVRELGDASVPFTFDVHAMVFNEDAPKLERVLHRVFGDYRVNMVNHRKEFFQVSISEIKQVFDDLGVEAKWTLASAAQQYRESRTLQEAPDFQPKIHSLDEDEIKAILAGKSPAGPPAPPGPTPRRAAEATPPIAAQQTLPPPVAPPPPLPSPPPLPPIETSPTPPQQEEADIRCPICSGRLALSWIFVGANKCLHCKGEFDVE